MRAFVTLRPQPCYRSEAFEAGFRACGYEVHKHLEHKPQPGDVLLIWNRYAHFDSAAKEFERRGLPVLVAENGYLGREWNGGFWYAMARNHHNGGGSWPVGDTDRWRDLGLQIRPWRREGKHVLVLAQRGIGAEGVRQPNDWLRAATARLHQMTRRQVIVRQHPGENGGRPLEADLADAWCCVTWGSGAAIKSLMAGVPVFHGFPRWIGAPAAAPFGGDIEKPFLGDRLPMFERLIWAQWSLPEIRSGRAMRWLLQSQK